MAEVVTQTRLTGREAELSELGAAVAAARAGGAEALALVGEAGIGKSALLASLRDGADGVTVLVGRAAEQEADVPFGLAVDLLDDAVAGLHPRRLESLGADRLAELGAVLPSVARHAEVDASAPGARPADRFHTHRALRALVELLGGPRPLLVLLDDLHWADPASLELVAHLLRRPPRVPHVLALAFRPVAGMSGLLDALRSAPHGRELHLPPLGRAAALELLGTVRDERLRERLADEAAGNPLFLRELARSAETAGAGIPRTVVAAVQREAAGVPPASRTLLDGAAVAGDPFDPELAAAAAGLAPGDAPGLLDHLVAAGLVRPGSDARSFAFRHPLVRRAIYDAAPPGWRLGAHERAAAALAARGAPAAIRAYHVSRCASPGDTAAVATLREAGDGARRSAPDAAVRWFDAARRLVPADDLAALAELDYRRMLALAAAGRTGEAVQVGAEALERPLGSAQVSWHRWVEELAGLDLLVGGPGKERLDEALRTTGQDDPGRVRLQVGRMLAGLFDPPDVRRRAASILQALGDEATPLRGVVHGALAMAALALGEPEVARAETATAEAIVAGASDGAVAERFGSILVLGLVLEAQERLLTADVVLGRARRVGRATGHGHFVGVLAIMHGRVLLQLGRLAKAGELAELAEDALRLGRQRLDLVAALALQARVLDAADRSAEGRALAAEGRRVAAGLPPGRGWVDALATLAALDAARDPERGLAAMRDAAGEDYARAGPATTVWLLGVATRAELALGREGAAAGRAERMRALAERHRLPVGTLRADTAAAAVALATGDGEGAAQLADRAAGAADRAGAVLDALEAQIVAGAAREDAAALRGVADASERLGAMRLRAGAARELRRLGERIPPAVRPAGGGAGLAALTPREREIAALVAAGSSNKQVGLALHLSEKTVENSLSRIYAKLGARSRVELATSVVSFEGG